MMPKFDFNNIKTSIYDDDFDFDLIYQEDFDGNKLHHVFNKQKTIEVITINDKFLERIERDKFGNKINHYFSSGFSKHFVYDENGNLIKHYEVNLLDLENKIRNYL